MFGSKPIQDKLFPTAWQASQPSLTNQHHEYESRYRQVVNTQVAMWWNVLACSAIHKVTDTQGHQYTRLPRFTWHTQHTEKPSYLICWSQMKVEVTQMITLQRLVFHVVIAFFSFCTAITYSIWKFWLQLWKMTSLNNAFRTKKINHNRSLTEAVQSLYPAALCFIHYDCAYSKIKNHITSNWREVVFECMLSH